MALTGWFHPESCSSPYQCGCTCQCPRCRVYDWESDILNPSGEPTTLSRCRVYWECCADEDAEFEFVGPDGSYGAVGSDGSVTAINEGAYSLITTGPDCITKTLTISMENDCPCPVGCRPSDGGVSGAIAGLVAGARQVATLTVFDFGTIEWTQELVAFPCAGVRIIRSVDLTECNHTITVPVKNKIYTTTISGVSRTCSFDYIDPIAPYLVGQITSTIRYERDDFPSGVITTPTATGTWNVYGATATETGPDGVTPIGGAFQLYAVLDSVTTVSDPSFGSCAPDPMYPPGYNTISPSDPSWTDHLITYPPDYPRGIFTADANPNDGKVGGASDVYGHFRWCRDISDTAPPGTYYVGTFAEFTMFSAFTLSFLPAEFYGTFRWESVV